LTSCRTCYQGVSTRGRNRLLNVTSARSCTGAIPPTQPHRALRQTTSLPQLAALAHASNANSFAPQDNATLAGCRASAEMPAMTAESCRGAALARRHSAAVRPDGAAVSVTAVPSALTAANPPVAKINARRGAMIPGESCHGPALHAPAVA
jgi:hypothetical protein